MKKTFAFILALIYLSTSMGAGSYLHYCEAGQGICLSQGKNDCCKEAPGHVQAEHHLQGLAASFKIHPSSAAVCSAWPARWPGQAAHGFSAKYFPHQDHLLPDKVPLFLRNCNFRI
ncbi:hypothetical protein Q4E93_16375 [Flavitalea sp. BT771]|uniref:hypothetical protein n=1 Tax=Flavitalea sp. BT771 TaxID=3063329 RepID=UPI0026E1C965|nr:hypothetical protein [Flavitalea sp. BT771]MDO6432179.1 hypothetical protein [Flavitalea sp. BT771]MDV6221089.1 hypothetical protein [Flavitalea sp. BT771]